MGVVGDHFGKLTILQIMASSGGSTAAASSEPASVSIDMMRGGPQENRSLFPNQTNEERWAMRFKELKQFKQVRLLYCDVSDMMYSSLQFFSPPMHGTHQDPFLSF